MRPPPIVTMLKTKRKTNMTTNNTNTVRLHRVLRAKPERVYRAFLDADIALWSRVASARNIKVE